MCGGGGLEGRAASAPYSLQPSLFVHTVIYLPQTHTVPFCLPLCVSPT